MAVTNHRGDGGRNTFVPKAFIATVPQESADLSTVAASQAAGDLTAAIVQELK